MRVLVTGALGNLGRVVSAELRSRGHHVVTTDLRTKATEKAARRQAGGTHLWADLTDADAVSRLLDDAAPDAVIHLAAIIPPVAYDNPRLAYRVNVEATRLLAEALAARPGGPRLVFASSMAVYGSRNPHTSSPPVTATTPPAPPEIYGAHKVECEELIAASGVEWTVLRVGAVISSDQMLSVTRDMIYLEGCLPTDGRVHLVDVRDVARAFAAAVDADCAGRTLLIGGDASHRVTQDELSTRMTAAIGFPGVLPHGRPGDPARDDAWFSVEWMDTDEAQSLLDFQRISFEQTLREARAKVGPLRLLGPIGAPLGRALLGRGAPYRGRDGAFADPWGVIGERWGKDVLA
ncbi:NAD-dependent epimerase/dehydratase family protein [Nocardioides sp. Bht2]|uniref:NAD-dependent epimerase/dehydratase family protein n=1 Tax=Nocardioides sp. Bht2 TaxID=3392297 RepID=UPI0039B52357